MSTRYLSRRRIRQVLTSLFITGALVSMFPPPFLACQFMADHSIGVALVYLGMGMIFLMVNEERLMFVCLGCSMAIALYINETKQPQRPTSFGSIETVSYSHLDSPFHELASPFG